MREMNSRRRGGSVNIHDRHVGRLRRNAQAKRQERNACSQELVHCHDPPVINSHGKWTINHGSGEQSVPYEPQLKSKRDGSDGSACSLSQLVLGVMSAVFAISAG